MSKLPIVKARQLVKALVRLGFIKVHQVGSHAQFRHPDGRRTTVPIHGNQDVKRNTLKSILADIEVSAEKLKEVL